MPTKLCGEPRCPNVARPGDGRCDEHMREYERDRSARRRADPTRGKAVKVYHSAKWQNTRNAVLTRDPICKVCDNELSTQVDHITPLSQGGDPYELTGLQGICDRCHWLKSAREAQTR